MVGSTRGVPVLQTSGARRVCLAISEERQSVDVGGATGDVAGRDRLEDAPQNMEAVDNWIGQKINTSGLIMRFMDSHESLYLLYNGR